jgi:undecaprenyl phosphate N,N'-diacetylbacillosamine 1-phosphate transferase
MQVVIKVGLYRKYLKRLMDICCSMTALIILSPVLLIISILVRVKLGSPVIFKQRRPGMNEKIFTLYKFRTMTNAKDEKGELIADKERLTRFGNMLRSSSLDELPELFNILIGNMSIVGPRPLAEDYLHYYNSTEKHRHDVLPGLTGLAQVNGRASIGWEQRFEYDIQYISNITFCGDMKIILKTIINVIKKDDIGLPGHQIDFDTYRKMEVGKINDLRSGE